VVVSGELESFEFDLPLVMLGVEDLEKIDRDTL
jgi:hypothetical protein